MLKNTKLSYFILILTLIFASTQLTACQTPKSHNTNNAPNNQNISSPNGKLWVKLRSNFKWGENPYKHSNVVSYINKYKKQGRSLQKLSKSASPHIHHVVHELEKNNLPGELAVLPMVESEYKPQATSRVGAAGIWQLTRDTARRYRIKQDGWYDGRRDITDSTKAALKHLKFLNSEFKGDWLLTLAAYNAGAGRVRQAIRKNQRLGKATDFWSLSSLPLETKLFVPKILALAYIIKNPHEVNANLDSISDAPYFTKVALQSQIDLRVAADLAQISYAEFKELNHGYISHSTHPNGPQQIYLPTYAVDTFNNNLNNAIKTNLVKLIMNSKQQNHNG